MPGGDSLSSRFDYLFEPLGNEDPADETDDIDSPVRDGSDDFASPSTAPVRMAFAAFVLATLGATAVVAMLLLQQPVASIDTFDVPAENAPASTDVAVETGLPAPTPALETPAEATQSVEPSPQPQQPAPSSQPTQTSSARAPQLHVTNSPTTRAPISVAPETRAPFPDQSPRGGGTGREGGGGLLGGGLPGPL